MHDQALEPQSAALSVGAVLGGRYRVLGELGRGGMGVVYRAEHIALEREVALKTMHAGMLRDPSAAPRVIREARAAAMIEHPGIAHVFDLDTHDGITFLAMERLRGEDLRHRILRHGVLQIGRVVELGIEICDAISAAHLRGVLHRDLTPRNVFLATDALGHERVKILDFGVAKLVGSVAEGAAQSERVFGTLAYMAPERLSGEADAADQRSDQYAIAVILYEALAGSAAFHARNSAELAMRIAFERPVSLRSRRPGTPAELLAIVERGMQREPARRWPSVAEMASALRATRSLVQDDSGTCSTGGSATVTAPGSMLRRAPSRARSIARWAWFSTVVLLASVLWYVGSKVTVASAPPSVRLSAPTSAITTPPPTAAAVHEPRVRSGPAIEVAPAPPARDAKRRLKAITRRPVTPEEELPPLLPR